MAEGMKTTKFAWGNKSTVEDDEDREPIVSLVEIMEEQSMEEQFQSRSDTIDSSQLQEQDCSRDFELALELSQDPDCSTDEQMAMKLQREFDREDELSRKFEQSKATTGKLQAVLAPDPYHYMREEHGESSDEEEGEDKDEMREFATNLLYESKSMDFPPCGFVKNPDGTIVTKHDPGIVEQRNTAKALKLPLALSTGDFIETRIGGKVFNELCSFGKTENKRQMRLKDKEEKATSSMSMDMKTRLTLLKWINSGEFDRVEEIIATGKESAVLHAILDGEIRKNTEEIDEESEEPENVENVQDEDKVVALDDKPGTASTKTETHFAVKVYKTTLAGFRNRAEYVKDDFRFKNPRRVMKIWAEKEFLNLKRLKRANIMCPNPIKLRKHVLLMSMIGDTRPAQKLKELQWTDEQMKQNAFEQVREIVIKMYKECQLVHGDLSEFNLLYHLGTVYVIDLAQAMDISHPSSLRFLHRDIVNVIDFFGRLGCEYMPSAHQLYHDVTGIEFDMDKDLYIQVESFERENRNMDLRTAKGSPANYELYLHQKESTGRDDSPSKPYN